MQDFRMYLGTYVNTQMMRICTDTYTDSITHLFTILCHNRNQGRKM